MGACGVADNSAADAEPSIRAGIAAEGPVLVIHSCFAHFPIAGNRKEGPTLTAASTHDSQVAIPLARTSEQRVVWLYDLMDAAYDAQPIIDDCIASGRVPVIDRNTRRDTSLKAEIAAERARRRLINIPDPRGLTDKERTTAERANARLKDAFGACDLRVRGHLKAFCHLMFGVAALAADSILRLFSSDLRSQPV
jgi:hypothetical protein